MAILCLIRYKHTFNFYAHTFHRFPRRREARHRSRYCLVHDELVFDAVREEVAHITPKIKELMTTALLLPRGVPLEVEVGSGRNWLQAH